MSAQPRFQPGSIVRARAREWIVLPESDGDLLHLRAMGGSEDDSTVLYVPLEREPVEPASFPPPDPDRAAVQAAGLLLRDALLLKLRAGAGPFRSFGNIAVEPRAYQLVPLLMALKQPTVRLLIADDVGIGKTIEAGLIARELYDRGEIRQLCVLCPPHLCEQWRDELALRFNLHAEIVRPSTVARLERALPAHRSIFEAHPFTIVSLDYIKSDRRRDEFLRACPPFVIVDEAHACADAGTSGRHQRFRLLWDLSEDPERHMLLLTATPHSGNEEAFYKLLGLLRRDFVNLKDLAGDARSRLREDLAAFFVQRRRPDIEEWQDVDLFPDRLSRERTYRLTGEWGALFTAVLDYARELVESAEGESRIRQRMTWWAALALLRCVSSSPAAAVRALRTRLIASQDATDSEATVVADVDQRGRVTVLDSAEDDDLTVDDTAPAGRVEDESARLSALIDQAERLGGDHDPKLATLLAELGDLLREGFSPVVFCRYIATADYVAAALRRAFGGHEILAVTGEFPPAEREAMVRALHERERYILVATDCLSEGINLQDLFDAVVHYDLSWNPTRHEQREGRVDRFGQSAREVRAVMIYGEDNPVDGAVLRVILRKAESIRRELGVMVPMPDDSERVTQAIMQTVLLGPDHGGRAAQLGLDFGLGETLEDIDRHVERDWQSARETAARSRTIFAQLRLKPAEVLPEWHKTVAALGSEADVERFVTRALTRLGARPTPAGRRWRLPLGELPAVLRERLAAADARLGLADFHYPPGRGATFVHRSHPLVSLLADHVTEVALSGADGTLVARTGAIYTESVRVRTVVFLLRLRCRITLRRRQHEHVMIAEECLAVAAAGDEPLRTGEDVLRLMEVEPARNMAPEMHRRQVQAALDRARELVAQFEALAAERADALRADHRRVRDAAEARGAYTVDPVLPVDVIGAYALVPAQAQAF